jgi:hypothetical protein
MWRHKKTRLEAWKTAQRLLRDVLDDGYDPYYVALALEHLVKTTQGDVIVGQICSIPALVAGMAAVSSERKWAKEAYMRRFASDPRAYTFWYDRMLDAHFAGEKDLVAGARRRLEELSL